MRQLRSLCLPRPNSSSLCGDTSADYCDNTSLIFSITSPPQFVPVQHGTPLMKLLDYLVRGSAEQDDLMDGLLTPAIGLSKRLLHWSGSTDRRRLFVIKFYSDWDHAHCPVMRWYKQQQRSSTRFQTIEHHRAAIGRYFHEFLLLKLTDGAVCRIERVGDGSRSEAVRYFGCKSYDLIQWFDNIESAQPAPPNGVAAAASELVAEIDLGQEFDLRDVLAICYSVQRVKRSSVYTLQRYNCYFLCLTILAILTRRVAGWEKAITDKTWAFGLHYAINLDSWRSRHCAFSRLCSMLEPNTSRPDQPILSALPNCLTPDGHTPDELGSALSANLWLSSVDHGIGDALRSVLKRRIEVMLVVAGGSSANRLRMAMNASAKSAEQAISRNKQLADRFSRVFIEATARSAADSARQCEDVMRMGQLEFRAWWLVQVLCWLTTGFLCLIYVLSNGLWLAGPGSKIFDRTVHFRLSTRLQFAWFLHKWMYLELFNQLCGLERSLDLSWGESIESLLQKPVIHHILNELDLTALTMSELKMILAWVLDKSTCVELIVSRILPGLSERLRASLEDHRPELRVTEARYVCEKYTVPPSNLLISAPQHKATTFAVKNMTCAAFQSSYIRLRIEKHAKRVEEARWAAAPLVRRDIELTMNRVWMSLPSGFGGTVNVDSESSAGDWSDSDSD